MDFPQVASDKPSKSRESTEAEAANITSGGDRGGFNDFLDGR